MEEFLEAFSNREIAIIIWLAVFTTFSLIFAGRQLLNVLKVLFFKAFLPFYLIYLSYFILLIGSLNLIKVWDDALYKDFLFWFFTTITISFFKTKDVNSWGDLNRMILHVFSWNMILDFLVGAYGFTLPFEIILVATSTIAGVLLTYTTLHRGKEDYSALAKFLNIFISALGFALICYVIIELVTDYSNVLTMEGLKSFLFSPVFTFLSAPLIIFTVFFIKYENMFLVLRRYKFLNMDRKRKIKYAIIRYANFNFAYINNAYDILIWKKKLLKEEESIIKYIKNAVKEKVDKSTF